MSRKWALASCLLALPLALILAAAPAAAATTSKAKPKSAKSVAKKPAHKPAAKAAGKKPFTWFHTAKSSPRQKAVPASDAKAFARSAPRQSSKQVVRQTTRMPRPTKGEAARPTVPTSPDAPETSVGAYGQTVYHSISDWQPGSLNRQPAPANSETTAQSRRERKPSRNQAPRERAQEVDERK